MLNYKYNKDLSCVQTRINGCVTISDALNYFDRIIGDETIDEPFVEIVDFSMTDDFDFGYLESNLILNKIMDLAKVKRYLGSVLIANSQLSQGMSNMFRSIGECRGIEIVLVSEKAEAMKAVEGILRKMAG